MVVKDLKATLIYVKFSKFELWLDRVESLGHVNYTKSIYGSYEKWKYYWIENERTRREDRVLTYSTASDMNFMDENFFKRVGCITRYQNTYVI